MRSILVLKKKRQRSCGDVRRGMSGPIPNAQHREVQSGFLFEEHIEKKGVKTVSCQFLKQKGSHS